MNQQQPTGFRRTQITIAEQNARAIDRLLSQHDPSMDKVRQAKDAINMLKKHYPQMKPTIPVMCNDYREMSDLCHRMDVSPKYRNHRYIADIAYNGGVISLRTE